MGNLPGPGTELISLALAGEFLTTGPPGKSSHEFLKAGIGLGSVLAPEMVCWLTVERKAQETATDAFGPHPCRGRSWDLRPGWLGSVSAHGGLSVCPSHVCQAGDIYMTETRWERP